VPSDRLEPLTAYAERLAEDGVVRGLIGPREVPRLWERHLLNCAWLSDLLDEGVSLCDIGSGAGLPGLVVAIIRPDVRVTLVEPLLRRTVFLDEVREQLGLDNVEVVRGRAEELHGARLFDVVTSRAVAPLPRLLDWSMPLVDAGGSLIALKGSSVTDEVEQASVELRRHRCGAPVVIPLGEGVASSPTYALRVSRSDPSALPLLPRAKGRKSSGSRRRTGPGKTG
jgi:16S rRNA (guanine527-N7)-methyltransferase